MSDTRDKKHLRLLPEILPAPAPNDTGSPRQRILARASRLGALAAAMASTMNTGCSGEQASGVNPPIVDIPGTSATGGAVVSTGGTVTPPQTTAPATNPIEPPTGYAVVDPMPPPAACMGVAPTIKATATWVSKKGGGFTIEVKLFRPSRPDASYGTADPPTAWGGKLASQQVAVDSVSVVLEPTAGATSAEVRVPVSCSQGASHVSIDLDLSKPPVAKGSIPVTLQDTW